MFTYIFSGALAGSTDRYRRLNRCPTRSRAEGSSITPLGVPSQREPGGPEWDKDPNLSTGVPADLGM